MHHSHSSIIFRKVYKWIEGALLKLIMSLSNIVNKVERFLVIILGTVLLGSLSAGVISRYVFNSPIFWSDELALFCLAWITFVGASMSLKAKASPSITMLTDSVNPKIRKVIQVIANVILLIFVVYIFYLSIVWITGPTISHQISTSLKWPKIYFYLSVPVSFFLMIVHTLELVLKAALGIEDTEVDEARGSVS